VAKSVSALRNGFYRYLRELGVRWLAPHEAWTVIPKQKQVRIVRSGVVAPRTEMLSYSGNGGLGPFGQPPLADGEAPKAAWETWDARNGMPRELQNLGNHVGEAINHSRQCEFRADRTMMAWYRGGRGVGPNGKPFPSACYPATLPHQSKPQYTHHGDGSGTYPNPPMPPWSGVTRTPAGCTPGGSPCPTAAQDPAADSIDDPYPDVYTGFGGAVQLWAEWIRDELAVLIQATGPDHPATWYPSAEAADGPGDCECTKCLRLLSDGPYAAHLTPDQQARPSTPADRYFHFTNEIAKFIAHWFGAGRGVSVDAYTTRCAVPTIPLQPNIVVQLVPAAQDGRQSNLSQEDLHLAWAAKRTANPLGTFQLSVSKQWALTNYNMDAPKISPAAVATEASWALGSGVVAFNVQNTHSSLTIGPHMLLLNELLWDANTDTNGFLDDWFAAAFGPAAPPIRRMFERWWDYYETTPHEVGVSCRDMLEAQQLADAALVEPATRTRVDHVKGYVRFQELNERREYWKAQYDADPAQHKVQYEAALEAFFRHIWAIYPTNVLHSYRLHRVAFWDVPGAVQNPDGTAGTQPGTLAERWLISNPAAPGWNDVRPWTSDELQQCMVAGAGAHPALVTRRRFSWNLAPLAPSAASGLQETTTFIGPGRFALHKDDTDITLELRTAIAATAGGPPPLPLRVKVHNPVGAVDLQEIPAAAAPGSYFPVAVTGPAGTYQVDVHTNDFGIQWRWRVPKSVPFVQTLLRNSTAGWDTQRRLHFYVPAGETAVVLAYNTRVAVDPPGPAPATQGIRFYDPSGTPVETTRTGLNQWSCQVPAGQDGAVWSLDGAWDTNVAVRFNFENCPPVIAYTPEQMMVPAELL
jgi:hypothetical protein